MNKINRQVFELFEDEARFQQIFDSTTGYYWYISSSLTYVLNKGNIPSNTFSIHPFCLTLQFTTGCKYTWSY